MVWFLPEVFLAGHSKYSLRTVYPPRFEEDQQSSLPIGFFRMYSSHRPNVPIYAPTVGFENPRKTFFKSTNKNTNTRYFYFVR